MSDDERDPLQDHLPKGIAARVLREAVDLSGFPLQAVVARSLIDRRFHVREEWAWIDPEREVTRTLDVVAEYWDGAPHQTHEGRSHVAACVLAECKQSRNPYLGFEAVSSPPLEGHHPRVLGLGRKSRLSVHPDDGSRRFWEVPIASALDLFDMPYATEPVRVSSLSRARPNGRKVELSGEEPFNSLVRPLAKATGRYLEHWSEREPGRDGYYGIRLCVPVAIIDAPLMLVRGKTGASEIAPARWLRLIAHHAVSARRDPWRGVGMDVIDLVSADYFEQFIDQKLLPFVNTFRDRLQGIQDIVLAGSAVIPGLSGDGSLPTELLRRLEPWAAPLGS